MFKKKKDSIMKAFTSIEQSKTLAKILPIESADMCYRIVAYNPNDTHIYQPYCFVGTLESDIPCWSFAALLEIIPKYIEHLNRLRIDIDNVDFSIWYDNLNGYGVNDKLPNITLKEPVDACVEMIIKLHELKML